jgi:hypothetical protein
LKIRRIPKEEQAGFCHSCHNRAELEVSFSEKRPLLRLCHRDGRYMAGVILSRIEEAEKGIPIPKPGERIRTERFAPGPGSPQRKDRDDESRGNR